jgi:hypothetical protein
MNSMAPGVSDARGVYVQSGDTSFRYGFNQTVTELDTPAMVIEVPTKAVVLGLETSIVEESGAVEVIDRYGTTTLDFPSRATTVVAIEGRIWIALEHGVRVFERNLDSGFTPVASIQLAGPIVQLIPLFDGTCVFVSGAGFVGILELNQIVAFEQ